MVGSKAALSVSAIAFALLFGGGAYIVMNLSSIAKPMTEKIATETLGVPVKIGGMDVSLQEMKVTVSGISVGNPKGFSSNKAIKVQSVAITLDKISKELITFKAIDVKGTDINLEVTQNGTNLTKIQKNAAANAAKKPANPDAKPINVSIKKFVLDQARLNPSITLLNKQELASITLPKITATNVGSSSKGIPANDAIAQITKEIIKVASKEANQAGFLGGLSTDVLKDMGQQQIDAVKGQMQNQVQDQIRGEVDKLGDSLKGMFR
jgi:uncharacterized protein involved in outer membrane biogenesis